MTYTKPNVFELGSAEALVLGAQIGAYLDSDFQTVTPDPTVPCEENGQRGFLLSDGTCVIS